MVIVIGLITTSIFVGKDLLFTAKIREDISSIIKYKTAVNTFELKYSGLPGDIKDSDEIFNMCKIYQAAMVEGVNSNGEFSSDMGITGNRIAGLETNDKISFFNDTFGAFSCNGNGDGKLAPDTGYTYEIYNVFFLLEQAGLVKGSYSPFEDFSPALESSNQYIFSIFIPNNIDIFNGILDTNAMVFQSSSGSELLNLLFNEQ